MVSFDAVVDEYARGRPGYPPQVFDALEPLAGRLVVDAGCGTGIAATELVARGARVVAVDVGERMVRHTMRNVRGLEGTLVGDAASLPFRDDSIDLLCFAQSWHWVDPARRAAEAARVLRPTGRWAGWWSHARADGERWFDRYWDVIEDACPAARRWQRDVDWGAQLAEPMLFDVGQRLSVPWMRAVTVEEWITDEQSKSYVADLPEATRHDLLATLRALLLDQFPTGHMSVRYETWLWLARLRHGLG